MSRATNLRASRSTDYPRNAWYVLATSDEVGNAPLARRALGVPIVLFRTSDGTGGRARRTATPTSRIR